MTTRVIAGFALLIVAGLGAWLLFSEQGFTAAAPDASLAIDARSAAPTRPAASASRSSPRIDPRTFQPGDDGATEPPPSGTGEIRVLVVTDQDQPVEGAIVSACGPAGGLHWNREQTGSDGIARLGPRYVAAGLEDTHIVVTAAGRPPALVPIEDRTRMHVVLGGELTLRGRVLVDGAAPRSRLQLTVKTPDDPTASWPEWAREVARSHSFGEMSLPFETDENGEFAVRGPKRGSQVTIEIPEGYAFKDAAQRRRSEVDAVCNGEPVVLDLVALNAITGRVTGALFDAVPLAVSPSGRPMQLEIRFALARAGARIDGTVRTTPSHELGMRYDRAMVETSLPWEFTIHFSGALDGADLEVWSPWGRMLGSRQIRGRVTQSRDIGAIEIGEPPLSVFHVTDPSGRPIAKARVLSGGHVSEPTDTEGRTSLAIFPGTAAVIAGAPRFKITRVRLPEKPTEIVEVRLEPSVTLIVRVRHEDPDASLTGLRVALAYDVNEATGAAAAAHEFRDVQLSSPGSCGRAGDRQTDYYRAEPGKDVVVSGFAAGEAIEVRVDDQYGHVVLREAITLPDDDVHAIEMVVRSRAQTIRGVVLDHRGKPLAGARVKVPGSWMTMFWDRGTDASGTFEIRDVYGTGVRLSASGPGHANRTLAVDEPAEPVTIRLERGRQIAVVLTGPATIPFLGQVTFEADGDETQAAQRGEQLFSLEAVPCKPGIVRASFLGESTSIAVGPEDTKVTLPRPE